jgi:hypothetical protein
MGSVSRVHTFASAAVLTAAQLNNEFDNLLTSSAINGGLDATNLGVTAGQITASKAIVVDGSRNLDDGTTSNQINNLVLSGTLTVAGATTQTGALSIDDTTNSTSTTTGSIHTDGGVGIALDLIVGDDVKLLTDSSVLSLGVGSDATLTHDGTTGLTIAANPVIVDSGDALTLDAHTGIVIFKDAGSEVLRFTEGNSGDVTIKLATNGKDLIFTDNGDATGLKVLDAAAGINVPGEVQTTKIAYTDGDDAITIADGGGVTTAGTLATTGAATLASLVCTAAGTFGGGYGATGATISTDGVLQANGAITSDGAVTGATLAGTVSTAAQNSITSASSLATVGTITSGTWQGTKVASAYLDDQTAHLNITQSFTGAKTFGAATQFNSTVTVGVNDTGYDVQLFGATAGSNILWDQSADDLIFTNAGIAVGSDATGDIYYRDASGFLARLAASTDGHVLTTGGAGTIPAFEALPGGGTFSGPGSSTENAIVRFTNTSGNSGDNSGILIDDSNNVTGAGNVTLSGELDAATGDFSGIIDVAGAATLASLVCTAGGTFGGGYGDTGATISTAGVGQFNGNVTTDGLLAAATMTLSSTSTISGDMTFVDNAKVTLGTGGDADLYYDGTNAILNPKVAGSGIFKVAGDLGVGGTTSATNWPFTAELIVEGTYPGIFLKNTTSHADVKNWAIGTTYGTLYIANDTDNTAPFRIDKDGNIGIGGTTPSTYANGNAALVVGVGGTSGSAVSEITIASDDAGVGELNFTDTADTTNQGYVKYDHANTILSLAANTYARFYVSGAICGINETLNGFMTQGLTIQQGTNTNEIFAVKSSVVTHGMTGVTETDTYGYMKMADADGGGLLINGLTDTSTVTNGAVIIEATLGQNALTAKTVAGYGVARISAWVKNGTSRTGVNSDGNLLSIETVGDVRFIFDAEGSAHAEVEWTTFDEHDDIALLHDIEATMVPDTFGAAMKYDAPYLQKIGIIGEGSLREENGKTRGMINFTKLQMLHHGAIRQVHQQLQDAKDFYEDKIAALESRLMRLEN